MLRWMVLPKQNVFLPFFLVWIVFNLEKNLNGRNVAANLFDDLVRQIRNIHTVPR